MWLRKFNILTGKDTNEIIDHTPLNASLSGVRIVDDAEAAKCRAALLVEKKAACAAIRAKNAIGIATAIPLATKIIESVKAPEPATAPAVEAAHAEPAVATETVADESPVIDELESLDLAGLKAVIDSEGLPVKKTFKEENLRPMIRAARIAKASEVAK